MVGDSYNLGERQRRSTIRVGLRVSGRATANSKPRQLFRGTELYRGAKRDGQRGTRDRERLFLKDGRQCPHVCTCPCGNEPVDKEKVLMPERVEILTDVFSNLQSMLVLFFQVSSTLDIIY